MIRVQMSDDIRKYEPKLVGPFSTRQLVAVVVASVFFLIAFVLLPKMDVTIRCLLALLIASPAACCGFVKMQGKPFEVIVIKIIYLFFLTPAKRKNRTEHEYRKEFYKIKHEDELRKVAALTPSQRKTYEKKKKEITYGKTKENRKYI